ncbi:MAG: hypothetical protein ABIS15_02605 [Gemmatimonadaceae bacterium]
MDAERESEGEGKPPFKVVKSTRPRRGGNRIVWLAIVVAVGMILAYAAGLLR